jgi:hypothetical protein
VQGNAQPENAAISESEREPADYAVGQGSVRSFNGECKVPNSKYLLVSQSSRSSRSLRGEVVRRLKIEFAL